MRTVASNGQLAALFRQSDVPTWLAEHACERSRNRLLKHERTLDLLVRGSCHSAQSVPHFSSFGSLSDGLFFTAIIHGAALFEISTTFSTRPKHWAEEVTS